MNMITQVYLDLDIPEHGHTVLRLLKYRLIWNIGANDQSTICVGESRRSPNKVGCRY
jgi:hypothetical protein